MHGIIAHPIIATLKPAAEWTGVSECVVRCKLNVNDCHTAYGIFVKMELGMMEEWQKNNSDHVIGRKITSFVN